MCEEVTKQPLIPSASANGSDWCSRVSKSNTYFIFFSNEEILNSHFQNCNVKKNASSLSSQLKIGLHGKGQLHSGK